jgi:Lon protease-like protein
MGEDSRQLAVFPLSLVLFRDGLLPLRIFEPRYQRMVSECLRAQQPFVVVSIVDGPEAGGLATIAMRGTLATIVDWEQLEDGLLGLLCEGGARVDLGDVSVEKDRLMRARVIEQPEAEPRPLPADYRWMAELLDSLLVRIGTPFDRLRQDAPSADHVANRLVELLPLPLEEKQRLFDIDDALLRLQRLAELISPTPKT